MLAAIGGHYHFPAAELLSFTADDLGFWAGALVAWREGKAR